MKELFWLQAHNLSALDDMVRRKRAEHGKSADISDGKGGTKIIIKGYDDIYPEVFSAINSLLQPEFVRQLFTDFTRFQFDTQNSVNPKYQNTSADAEFTREVTLEQIPLLDHVLRTTNIAAINTPSKSDRRTMLLYSLLHDVGKSPLLKRHYNINANVHELASADYAEKLAFMGFHSNQLSQIALDLRNSMDPKKKVSRAMQQLHMYDAMARNEEESILAEYKAGQKEGM